MAGRGHRRLSGHAASVPLADSPKNTCLPDDKHVSAAVRNVGSEQGGHVIGRHGRAHVPRDDVHPVGEEGRRGALKVKALYTYWRRG